eukprot:TRINITY_DN4608_c0_g1_i1.p1 TRINITY_DN4608_c0_g1~~TRINITY_DN4608_c0_g1_i1.p1  ORF type:complete len:1069 (+),score=192.62 TRINITY_DN4608_c0_g1_i1:89-3295(+)
MHKQTPEVNAARQQQEVERRRLVPIYETQDAGNLKKALKDINTYLKKSPKSQQGKCCKAIILEKMGELQECYAICQEVVAEKPSDPIVLNQLKIAFTRLGKVHDNSLLSEQLAAADPNNKTLAKHVFYAYLKELDFKKPQEHAFKLYRKFNKVKHFHWSIACNFIQSGGTPLPFEWERLGPWASTPVAASKPVDTRILALCEAMLAKNLTDIPPTNGGVVLLYLSVLTSEGKWQQALDVLNGPLGAQINVPQDKKKYQAQILVRLNQWNSVRAIAKDFLLQHNADDWGALQTYVDATFLGLSTQSSVDQEKTAEFTKEDQERISEARAFLTELKASKPVCRGPFLSLIDLESRLFQANGNSGELLSLLKTYIHDWGQKLCCFNDIRKTLQILQKQLAPQDLLAFVQSLAVPYPESGVDGGCPGNEKGAETSQPTKEFFDRFQAVATVEEFKRYLGYHAVLSREERVKLINELWGLYIASNIGLKKEVTENGPGDNLALLSAHLLFDLYKQSKENRYLLDAITILEYARLNAKFNAQIKLFLMHLYNYIGAAQASHDIYLELEVKHIQMDSLSYLSLEPLLNQSLSEKANSLSQKIRRFHDARKREIPDYMTGPFRSQNYIKVQEFSDFASKLERSHQLAITRTEEVLLALRSLNDQNSILRYLSCKQTFSSSSAKPYPYSLSTTPETLSALVSNQDTTVIVKWDPPIHEHVDPFFVNELSVPLTSANVVARSRPTQIAWLHLRSLMSKLLAAAVPANIDLEEGSEGGGASSGSGGGGRGQPAPRGKGGKTAKAAPAPKEAAKPKPEPVASNLSNLHSMLKEFISVLTTLYPGVDWEADVASLPLATSDDFARLNWRFILECHRASAAIGVLVASEGKAGEAEQEEAKKRLTLLCALLTRLNEHIVKTFRIDTQGTGGSFNCYSIAQLNAYSIDSVGSTLTLLLQCWLLALPPKQRKGNVGKLFQPIRPLLQSALDGVQSHYTQISELIKDATEPHKTPQLMFACGNTSGDSADSSVVSFLAHCKEEKLRSVVDDCVAKVTGSYIVSLRSMLDVIDKRTFFFRSLRAHF